MGRDIALPHFESFFHILPIMSQQQEPPPQAVDGFSRLPMEMNVQIMMLLNPQQLLSLISASPAVRRHFLGDHRASIMKPHLTIIYKYYGHPANIPLIVFLTRVRALRARLKGRPRSEIENALHPILTSVLSHDIMSMPPEWEFNLHIVAAAKGLIPEICHVFNKWWKKWWTGPKIGKTPPQHIWIFVECFLRFECFCNISYVPDGFLFQDMLDFKHIFLHRFQTDSAFSPSDLRPWGWDQDCEKRPWEDMHYIFDAPAHYKKKYLDLIRSVRRLLPSGSSTAIEPGNETPETATESEIADFLGRTHRENELFCYRLSVQGNNLLAHLWSLKPQARSCAIVKEFSNFLASDPFRDSIYPHNLEEMKSIHKTWQFARYRLWEEE
ncbi:uracil catabolism 4 [Fusarium tjaetaba]|uniref:Uracil catabolism 4 n=1 Tax=Fusarium tjaetaba TaxID=1567544 RepID=A0A8H5W2R9_9HYPO|nr:uracil catabolism 4 [Fusarium tjaetaba]KAF5643400.1 uracil catabolism 4 [Fusarium tjaetaba]